MDKHIEFTEEASKFALSSNKDKRLQSVDSNKSYEYGTGEDNV